MSESTKMLSILQAATPADAPLTVSYEVKVLEILGIVKEPELVGAMQLAAALLPPSTPATLKGLVQMLGALMHMSKKATAAHHDSISTILSRLESLPDINLTFGSFLSVCQKLLEASSKSDDRKRK
jgi:hypothetical protein